MVSVALFTIVMTISVGTLLALIAANQKAQSLKSVINNLNFGVESMARTIRTGRDFYCTDSGSIGNPLPTIINDCPTGDSGLVLTDEDGNRIAYRSLNATGAIERTTDDGATWVALTAPEVVITGMLFYVTGTDPVDTLQPTVTISIRGRVGTKAETDSEFNVQTTVTQRVLDQ